MSFREIAAFFIPDRCLFGAYPTQHQIRELEEWGVNLIVNLTNKNEKNIRFYSTLVKTINFPIPDNKAPNNLREFCALVIYLTKQINQGKKIYIHCKGGHGRSGVLVASILCFKFRITPHESIILTTKYHSTRPIHARRPKMNEYWKNKGSPQTSEQKQFIMSIFQPYNITKNSPFNTRSFWIRNSYEQMTAINTVTTKNQIDFFSNYIDIFLMDTNLGPINGNNGYELEQYRNSLIENSVFF
jgi:hypothetical protein